MSYVNRENLTLEQLLNAMKVMLLLGHGTRVDMWSYRTYSGPGLPPSDRSKWNGSVAHEVHCQLFANDVYWKLEETQEVIDALKPFGLTLWFTSSDKGFAKVVVAPVDEVAGSHVRLFTENPQPVDHGEPGR